jgi:gentisate 1,2-dioxygenase
MTDTDSSRPDSDVDAAELERLHADFAHADVSPLWTRRDNLMPLEPEPQAVPHLWRWADLHALAERSGRLVPVGRGGERRALGLANPGLGTAGFATPTLWCAIQYLGGHETAPVHRHTQNAFRFVLQGEGVWTVVDGDPVAMRRGDLLLTPGWQFHGHYNTTSDPMAWIDGLDAPLAFAADVGFFEYGADEVPDGHSPALSRNERMWAHPGLRPLSGLSSRPSSPLAAYRWEHTDRALAEQLALETEGHPGTVAPGHAAVRFVNVTTGGDVMPTLRAEMHRLRAQASTQAVREVGSSVWQVFDGAGTAVLNGAEHRLATGDLFAVPSWTEWAVHADDAGLDLFRFSDAPVVERLGFARSALGGPAA